MSGSQHIRHGLVALALLSLGGCATTGGSSGAVYSGPVINKDTPDYARSDAPANAVYANYFALLKSMSQVPGWTSYPDIGTGPGIQGTPEELQALRTFRNPGS